MLAVFLRTHRTPPPFFITLKTITRHITKDIQTYIMFTSGTKHYSFLNGSCVFVKSVLSDKPVRTLYAV